MTSSNPGLPSSQSTMDTSMTNGTNLLPQFNIMPIQPPKEYNIAYLCRLGQETVQEIVTKTIELFQNMKAMIPPNGTTQSISMQDEKKIKIRELLKTIDVHFKRLRKMYERCNECCAGMEYIQIETLIPIKDDDNKVDDKKFTSNAVKSLEKEHQELTELLQLKNRQIKEIIDNLRGIVWEINTMLVMRKP